MDTHASIRRRVHPALAAAGIVVATVLALTVKLGHDMADYLETSAHLATGEPPQGGQDAARAAAGDTHPVAQRAVAAAP